MLGIVIFHLLFTLLCFPFFHHFLPSSRSYACTCLLRVSICIRLKQRQENIIFTFTLGTVVTITCSALKDLLSTANTLSIGALLLDIRMLRNLSKTEMGPALYHVALWRRTPLPQRRSIPCPCTRPLPSRRGPPASRAQRRWWSLSPLSART